MKDLDILNYKNLFPAEVSRTGQFLLCLLSFSQPFHRSALRLLLKPVMGDAEASTLLKDLTDKGYLYTADTGQGRFYGLTAQAIRYLDVARSGAPHRRQRIADKSLLTDKLQSYLIAQALFNRAALVCLDFGGFPRTVKDKAAVLAAMTTAVQNREIPFVDGYNEALCRDASQRLMKYLQVYDAAQAAICKLAAQINAASVRAKLDPAAAKEYEALCKKRWAVETTLADALPSTQALTYTQGQRVLSLAVLAQNGIVLQHLDQERADFGLLNNTPYGLSQRRLAARLDYIVSLADALKVSPSVVLYTMKDSRDITEQRLDRLDIPFPLPPISFYTVPSVICSRADYWRAIQLTYGTLEE